MQTERQILVAGHRGCMAIRPENTMVSFQKAIELGVDMIEMDLNLTKDGHLVVIHDNTVDRTTDGTGFVRDKTLEEVLKLDAGIRFSSAYEGVRIPTFREYLELVSPYPDLLLNVEIKEKTAEALHLTVSMLKEFGLTERSWITCFDADILKDARRDYGFKTQGFPDNMLAHFEDGPDGTRSLLSSVGIPMDRVTQSLSEEYLNMGIAPWSWAVNDAESLQKSINAGIVLVTSNDPEVPLSILRRQGAHK
ncbi:glycerophosphodiester phosphodiesterase [Ethanoligenens sp.]|uniref:glycerophosphodiester phosphodiesterase n=1 Tax=Ethanoligenens sp. TaxID=2099655 RepID=UPI0039E9CBAB